MLTIQEARAALNDRVLTIVARETGINRNTLYQIREGRHENPTLDTLRRLSEYLAPQHRSDQ